MTDFIDRALTHDLDPADDAGEASLESTPDDAQRSRPARAWQAFHRFRGSRPFWGCLILFAGGWFVLKPVVGSFQMMTGLGVGGAQVYILGGGMMAAAVVAFAVPAQRHFPAIMAMIFSVASLPLANLGGWLLGMLLGIIGSGLVFAWTPYTDKQLEKFAERARKRAERKARKR